MKSKFLILILTLVLVISSCSGAGTKSRKNSAEKPEILAGLDMVEAEWESDESGRFSYITAHAGHDAIFFDVDYAFPDNLFIYQTEVNGELKYGYMDIYFNRLTEPISNDHNIFNYGMARVTEDDGSYLIDDNFVRIDEYYPGFMVYGDDLLIVDWTNKPIEEPNVIHDVDFESFLVPVKSDEAKSPDGRPLYGYTTLIKAVSGKNLSENDFIIAPLFEAASLFYEGMAAVAVNDKWGYIDESGAMVIEAEYDEAWKFYKGCAIVYDAEYHKPNDVLKQGYTDEKDLGRWGMINMKGNAVSKFLYRSITPFDNDLAYAVIASPSYYLSSFYDILRPDGTPAYSASTIFRSRNRAFADDPIPFSEGLMPVTDGSYVYINENGERAFEDEFEKARGFHDGMAAVQSINNNVRWGYIDMTGSVVLPDIYTYACDFDEGYAYVRDRLSAKGYLIDKLGEHYLEELELHGITRFNEEGYALGFNKDTREVAVFNEKTGRKEKVMKTFYTYYVIHVNY